MHAMGIKSRLSALQLFSYFCFYFVDSIRELILAEHTDKPHFLFRLLTCSRWYGHWPARLYSLKSKRERKYLKSE